MHSACHLVGSIWSDPLECRVESFLEASRRTVEVRRISSRKQNLARAQEAEKQLADMRVTRRRQKATHKRMVALAKDAMDSAKSKSQEVESAIQALQMQLDALKRN